MPKDQKVPVDAEHTRCRKGDLHPFNPISGLWIFFWKRMPTLFPLILELPSFCLSRHKPQNHFISTFDVKIQDPLILSWQCSKHLFSLKKPYCQFPCLDYCNKHINILNIQPIFYTARVVFLKFWIFHYLIQLSIDECRMKTISYLTWFSKYELCFLSEYLISLLPI